MSTVKSELLSVALPGFPHQIDIYKPVGAAKAVVFLHGGGGYNHQFAYELGINFVNAQPSVTTANWAWLEGQHILAVFPQGQAISGAGYTWNNHVMDSGQDDVAFLQALASYIRTKYGISAVYLAGHSSGAMMVHRMWCESPATYGTYLSLAGAASNYYLSTLCEPAQVQPFYGIAGNFDSVLQVNGNWDAPTWIINPDVVAMTPATFVNPTLIGEWSRHRGRSQFMCGETPILTDKTSDGSVETWTNCVGRIKLQRALLGAHTIDSLETATGFKMIDLIAAFIGGV